MSVLLAVLMLVGSLAVGIAPVTALVNTGDNIQLSVKWNGTSDPNTYNYSSSTSETRDIRLKVSYKSESVDQSYNKGEIIITVPGFDDASRSLLGTTMKAVAADRASSATKSYNWSYTYNGTTDTYTFTNNMPISKGQVFEGSFEIIWSVSSRDSYHNFQKNVQATLFTAGGAETKSNTIVYKQTRTRDTYASKITASAMYTAEGLGSDTINVDDYVWVNYDYNPTVTYKARGMSGYGVSAIANREVHRLWVAEGSVIQNFGFKKTEETREESGITYECWQTTAYVSTSSMLFDDIRVLYPKSLYEGKSVKIFAETWGTYWEEDQEVLLTSTSRTIALKDYSFKDIPGNIYGGAKRNNGVKNTYSKKHCSDCTSYGCINSVHLATGEKEYSSNLAFTVLYRARQAEYYDIEMVDDFLDVTMKDGNIRQLRDDEYKFTKLYIPPNTSVKNYNGIGVKADTYPVEVYVRREGQAEFDTEPALETTIKTTSQTLALPQDTVSVRIMVKGIKESFVNANLILYYKFTTDDDDINVNGGKFYNNMFIKLYSEKGWRNDIFGRGEYSSKREYDRDIATYGTALDREVDSIHILETMSEHTVSARLTKSSETKITTYFTGQITGNYKLDEDCDLQNFSIYTIVPEKLKLDERYNTPETIMEKAYFLCTGVNIADLAESCTVEIIPNYKGSGREYIAFHFSLPQPVTAISGITIAGIPMYIDRADIDVYSQKYTFAAAGLIDDDAKWYAAETDNLTRENGIWKDIDRDGITNEILAYSSNSVSYVTPESTHIELIKSVKTDLTGSYVNAEFNGQGTGYVDSSIPKAYKGANYSYRVMTSTGENKATNMILADTLEEGPLSEWQGEFVSVDVSYLKEKFGITPKIYYSTVAKDVYTQKPNFNDGDWTITKPAAGVKAVAVDLGKNIIAAKRYVYVDIIMKAPKDMDGELNNKITENRSSAYYELLDAQTGKSEGEKSLTSVTVPVKLTPCLGTLKLIKVDDERGNTLRDAVFSLYRINGTGENETRTLVKKGLRTDANGEIIYEKAIYGIYEFEETAAPAGYAKKEDPIRVTLDDDKTGAVATVTVENTAITALTKSVKTELTKDYVNAELNEEGTGYIDSSIPQTYKSGEYSYRIYNSTGDSKEKDIIIADTLEEGPLSEWQGEFLSVDYSDLEERFGITPTVYYSTVSKDVYTQKPDFSDGDWTTDKPETGVKAIALDLNGHTIDAKQYLYVEIMMKAPEDVYGEAEGKIAENRAAIYYEKLNAKTDQSQGQESMISENVPVKLLSYYGNIKLTKIDEETREILQGITFDLYRINGSEEEEIRTLVKKGTKTSAKGEISYTKLPYGIYEIEETKTLSGYVKLDDPIRVVLDGDKTGTVKDITVENSRELEETSLHKSVKTVLTGSYVNAELNEEETGYEDSSIPKAYKTSNYSYRITASTGESKVNNMILADTLEEGPLAEWQGEFVSVDVSDLEQRFGITPTVYYSTVAKDVYTQKPDFNDGDWTTTKPASGVKSIAVYLGENIIPGRDYVYIDITMKAPEDLYGELEDKITENRSVFYGELFDRRTDEPQGEQSMISENVPVKLTPYLGTLRLTKEDEETEDALEGAIFDLYRITGRPGSETRTLVKSGLKTNMNGQIICKDTKYGIYEFEETTAPTGYIKDATPVRVTLQGDEAEEIARVTVTNERKLGKASLKKISDRRTDFKLEGAKFSVYNAEDDTLVQDGNDPQYNLVTGENGEITVENLPWGDYYLQEIEAPAGYNVDDTKLEFTIDAESAVKENISFTFKNPQKNATAILEKTELLEDGTPSGAPLSGGIYQLYSTYTGTDKLIGTYVTDSDGRIYADDLAFGEYYFVETVPPKGYFLNNSKIHFTVDADNTETDVTELLKLKSTTTDQRKMGNLWAQKFDEKLEIVVGAEYGFFDANTDQLLSTHTTDSDGLFVINNILWGEYYLQETYSPQGYELNETKYPVTVNANTVNAEIGINLSDNREKGLVKLIKVDQEAPEVTLPNAVFTLYKSDGSVYRDDLVTGEDGVLLVADLEWGSYYFVEKTAPDGYGLNPSKIRFSVNNLTAGKTQELVVEDPPLSCQLKVTKKIKAEDVVVSHGLATFTFKVQGNSGRVYYRTITFSEEQVNKAGSGYISQSVVFADIPLDTYVATEEKTIRYTLNKVEAVDGTVSGQSGVFDLTGSNAVDLNAEAIFTNDKTNQDYTTHTGQVTNVISRSRKLTGISAVWNSRDPITSEVLDRTLLDVYAVYDDGEQIKLADDAYTLDPETLTSNVPGTFTVNVTYSEGGKTYKDGFEVYLQLAPLFTWYTLTTDEFTEDGVTYAGTVSINGYTGSNTTVSFPSKVMGPTHTDNDGKMYKVTRIGNASSWSSISGMGSVERIIFQEGLEEIGNYAFYMTMNMKGNLTIPNSVKTIGDAAFCFAGFTGTLDLGEGVEIIGPLAFATSNFIGDLVIPDSVITIKDRAFYNCDKLDGKLVIGENVETIGAEAFSGCGGLSGSLIIPDNVTSVGAYAFQGCTGFTGDLYIGDGVTTIGANAFASATNFTGSLYVGDSLPSNYLTASYIPVASPFTGNLYLGNSITTIPASLFDGDLFTGTLTLGSNITSIGTYAFRNCKFTGDLEIPNTVTIIGAASFYGCSDFTGKLIIGNNVTSIGQQAFSGCSGFTGDLTIPNSVTSMGTSVFSGCSGFKGNLSISNRLTTINSTVFIDCSGLTGDLIIPNGVTSIGSSAFNGCSGLTGNLIIPDSVTDISSLAFNGCSGFTGDLIIPDTVTSLATGVFKECSGFTGDLYIGNSVQSIGLDAFSGCSGFTGDLYIGNSVATISSGVFTGATNFTGSLYIGDKVPNNRLTATYLPLAAPFTGDLYIGNSITSISSRLFDGDLFTGTLTFGENMAASIGNYAFRNCQFTGTTRVPATVTTIGTNAFQIAAPFALELPTKFSPNTYGCTGTVTYY